VVTFNKRQKEMKRLEKQKLKAERRAQKKMARNSALETPLQPDAEGQMAESPTPENGLEGPGDASELA
jgi:hypothetical protein